jgi:acyl-CoA dehydrogenase
VLSADIDTLYELPQQYRELQIEARELAASVAEHAAAADESDAVDPTMRAALAASGLPAIMVTQDFGGRFPIVDSLAITVVREALAAVSGHLDSLFAMQGIGSFALSSAGSEQVRKKWLPAVGSLQAIAALALTEPSVGSDLKAIATTVAADGSDLVVTGHKSFITNAGDADFYTVLAKEGSGHSVVLVPADLPGVAVTHPHQIIAPHVLGDVVFEDVRVPAENRIGEPEKGFALVLATLATFRVSVAGAAVGIAQAALNEALRHTTEREQFGVPLARLGPVPSLLALSWTEIEMSRSLTYRAAAAAARDPYHSLHLSSMAKVGATEMVGRVVDRAVQVMGRYGLVRGSVIERFYREARPMRIYEGSTELILDSLAKQLFKGTK